MRMLFGLIFLVILGCSPATPQISTENIESIVVTLYKSDFIGVEEDLTIVAPKDEWSEILAFTLPDKWADTGPGDLKIGSVKIQYKDKKAVSMDLFFAGKNPCMVTLDGKKFYYAKNIEVAPDGAMDFVRKVFAIRKAISKEKEENKNRKRKGDGVNCP